MSLEAWSDALGLLSGVALLVTAWRNDGLYGFVDRLRAAVAEAGKGQQAGTPEPLSATRSVAAEPDKMASSVISALEAELTTWSWVDRWSLRMGAFLLLLSYGLKVAATILK